MQRHGGMENSHQCILELAAQRGLIRPRDLDERGLPSVALTRLVRQGLLTRMGRGLYARPDRIVSEHGTLAEVARKHPQAIVCLLSALRVHDLTTQSPFEVWLAIPNKARAPKMGYPPLQEAWRAKRVSMDKLWRYATLCRVANVMRPYMESLS
jgi:predicted transcriptional regulator of viral defense system